MVLHRRCFSRCEPRAIPRHIVNPLRNAIAAMNADVAVGTLQPLEERIDLSNAQPRLVAQLSSIFGVLALVLAATGLYGVLSYGVARRTNEIGIRMALGSGKRRVIGMILRETSVMIAIGLVAGAAAAVCTRFIASRLYGLSALDPLTVFVAAGVLLCGRLGRRLHPGCSRRARQPRHRSAGGVIEDARNIRVHFCCNRTRTPSGELVK
jgi:hypothetical protein